MGINDRYEGRRVHKGSHKAITRAIHTIAEPGRYTGCSCTSNTNLRGCVVYLAPLRTPDLRFSPVGPRANSIQEISLAQPHSQPWWSGSHWFASRRDGAVDAENNRYSRAQL